MSVSEMEGGRRGGWLPLAGIAWAVLVSSTLLQVCDAAKGKINVSAAAVPSRLSVWRGGDVVLRCGGVGVALLVVLWCVGASLSIRMCVGVRSAVSFAVIA